MAFVSAVPVRSSARATALTGRAVASTSATSSPDTQQCPTSRRSPVMAVEFQTYSGGLDRLTAQPYSITRYLFKNSPSTLSDTDELKDAVVNAGLRQLFGNAYIMEEERDEFYTAESKFRCGEITAKEFARAVAKSRSYRSRFFDNVSQFRFFELNFKHFLGRAPHNQVEYSKHFKIFAEGGYDAEVDSYFDDIEYDQVFGEDCMPYTRFRGTYAPINQFNRMCTLEGGFAGSDKNKPQMLVTSLAANVPTTAFSVVDGLPAIPNAEHPSRKYDLPDASLERFRNELEIAKARALQCQLDLDKAYKNLDTYRDGFSTFTNMVADMDISTIPGPYFKGPVVHFPNWDGSSPAPWGTNGVDRLNGPVKAPAAVVSKKEKQLERIKQLIVDLERRVSVLEADRESPALTPEPKPFELAGMVLTPLPVVEEEDDMAVTIASLTAPVDTAPVEVSDPAFDTSTLITDGEDSEADESRVIAAKPIEVESARQIKDVGRLPKELMEEMEEERKEGGGAFGGPSDGRLEFPGDGSEMVIGS